MSVIDNAAAVGWFTWGTGTVGITKGETLRLSLVIGRTSIVLPLQELGG
jgi:hypothetical protein